jgi:hypothetical protein
VDRRKRITKVRKGKKGKKEFLDRINRITWICERITGNNGNTKGTKISELVFVPSEFPFIPTHSAGIPASRVFWRSMLLICGICFQKSIEF